MIKKVIRRKIFYEWIDSFINQSNIITDDLHIDYVTFSTVKKHRWRHLLWELYREGRIYLQRNSSDVYIMIYACIRIYPEDSKIALSEIKHFYFDYKRMPPSILLSHEDPSNIMNEKYTKALSIGREYNMRAWLRHDDDDPCNRYYLYMSGLS